MVILLGSSNPSKNRALEKALMELNISDYEIMSFNVDSGVNSKPIGYEIIRGADNRNKELKRLAFENNIKYDYLCSLEGGFSLDENGLPFVVTYCITEDVSERKSTGKSLGIRLSKKMFDFVKSGGSLNKVIEEIINESNNKQSKGITGYLTGTLYDRESVDKDSVISSFIPFIYQEERTTLELQIEQHKLNKNKNF